MQEWWFKDAMRVNGLQWLQNVSYHPWLRRCLLFIERLHKETSSFHLLIGEIIATLDDLSCLLHLPIEGQLLELKGPLFMNEAVYTMVKLMWLRLSIKWEKKGVHERFGWLRADFKKRLQEHGDVEEFHMKWDQTPYIYLLYLVDVTLFNDKSVNYVDVTDLKY